MILLKLHKVTISGYPENIKKSILHTNIFF